MHESSGACVRRVERVRFTDRVMKKTITTISCLVAVGAGSVAAEAQSLKGSRASLYRQQRMAEQHGYSFLRSSSEVHRFVSAGYLVRFPGNADYELASVSFPYGRQELKLFVERLASQYRSACGERLVVTSLTRPFSHQPGNASDLSVHPAGMAVDLRMSSSSRCRSWLERTLLDLERARYVEATREQRPPHYHVVVNSRPYATYVARGARATSAVQTAEVRRHKVRSGDSLWTIARRYGTTVAAIEQINGLSSSRIKPGQSLIVP